MLPRLWHTPIIKFQRGYLSRRRLFAVPDFHLSRTPQCLRDLRSISLGANPEIDLLQTQHGPELNEYGRIAVPSEQNEHRLVRFSGSVIIVIRFVIFTECQVVSSFLFYVLILVLYGMPYNSVCCQRLISDYLAYIDVRVDILFL